MFPIPTTTRAFISSSLMPTPRQRMAGDVAVLPQHHAEAARIAQAQRGGAENEVHVIVIAGKRFRVDRAQASRHAQVHDERAGVALEQQILSAPLQPLHPLADEDAREPARNALAQIGIAHHDARDRFAEHERLDAAAGDLDFRQLWHGRNPMFLSGLGNIPKLALYDTTASASMLNPPSLLPLRALRLFAALVFVVFAGCALAPLQAAAGDEQQDESDAEAPIGEAPALAPEPIDRSTLPKQELTET